MSEDIAAAGGEVDGFDLDKAIPLHPLRFLEEEVGVTVGRLDIDSYCVLPAEGAALLRILEQGSSPRQAAAWFAEIYGESVDMPEFLTALHELGFVARPGETVAPRQPVRWQRLGRAIFSPAAWVLYLAVSAAATVLMIRHPQLVPHYRNLFFTRYLTVVLLLGLFGQIPFILLHESFHALAGRRLGLRSHLGIGHRLYFVVVETSMDGLITVPRRKRYLPILAGMLADVLIVAVLTLIAAATIRTDGTLTTLGEVCLAMAFAVIPRFLWQFYFYLQTDIYHVVVTVLGCVDLQRAARCLLLNRVNRTVGRSHRLQDESALHPRDRAVARWYAWLVVVGYGISIGTLLLVAVPTVLTAARRAIRSVSGESGGPLATADAAVFLLFTIGQLCLAGVIALRQRHARRSIKSSDPLTRRMQ